MTAHLRPESYAQLLAGKLPLEEVRAMAAHLETPCGECCRMIEEHTALGLDPLDPALDDALHPEERTHDELGFAKVVRELKWRREKRTAAKFVAGLAAAAAVALVVLPLRESPTYREKGPAAPVAAKLELLVRDASGAIHPAGSAPAKVGETVLFRVETAAPACVHLWRASPSAERLTDKPACVPAGATVLSQSGEALGLPLDAPGNPRFAAFPAEVAPEEASKRLLGSEAVALDVAARGE